MVRNIAGLLHDAGKGKLAPDEVPSFLQGRPRELLPSRTAPACGLTLIKVHYDGAFPGSPDPGQDAAAGQGGQA